MRENLSNKSAVVTGASRGIGKAIASALHRAGARVVITGRHTKTLESAAEEIGENCLFFECDHSDPDSIQTMSDHVLNEMGPPDILINNAGVMLGKSVLNLSLKDWNDVIGTNLTGVFLTTKAFLSGMIEKNSGDIVMISSMSGKKGDPGASAYAASKFGLQGFSQALLHEVRQHNIRVMVLNPSSVNTSEEEGPKEGPGLKLHAKDIADTIVHTLSLPRRTVVCDMKIWGTNPF
jgi:3-oxoacyl-[acyl-carrier protein] reductase